jgi:putative oxidoreductase
MTDVQRLFNMFPPGFPGMALLALRVSVGLALLIDAFDHGQTLSAWLQGAGALLSVALFAGYLTPIVALIALVFHALFWTLYGADGALLAGIVALDALALAALGPGAYSFDSYRFGRRVVLPPR